MHAFFDALGAARSASITHVCADGADWIAGVVAARAPQAILCADPLHVVSWATGALDEARREVWRTPPARPGLPPRSATSAGPSACPPARPRTSSTPATPCGRTRTRRRRGRQYRLPVIRTGGRGLVGLVSDVPGAEASPCSGIALRDGPAPPWLWCIGENTCASTTFPVGASAAPAR